MCQDPGHINQLIMDLGLNITVAYAGTTNFYTEVANRAAAREPMIVMSWVCKQYK
jgi:hypothetical protein